MWGMRMWGLWMLSTKSVWDSCLESNGTNESEMMKYYNGLIWLYCPISYPVDASRYLRIWLDLTTTHRRIWLFSSTSTYHLTDLLTAHSIAHLVVHGTSGSINYETIPHIRLETWGCAVDRGHGGAVMRRPSPTMRRRRWLWECIQGHVTS